MIPYCNYNSIFLDTCIWIYFLEGHPRYGPFVKDILGHVEKGAVEGIISTITFTEILTGPFRKGDEHLAHEYYALIYCFPHLTVLDVSLAIAADAARIRGTYNFAAPDALLLSSALQGKADVFLTNDRQLLKFKEIKILLLDDNI